MDGKPVTTGRVDFFPEEGRPSSGAIGEDGQYQLTTFTLGDGAKPGKYIVTITAHVGVDDEPQYASMDDELNGVPSNAGQGNGSQQARWLVPQRYSSRSSSGLTAEVGDRRAYDFPLKSKL